MKKELAEALLTKIMNWTDAEKAAESVRLESLATYKYDEYQQFAPGGRFMESLALWLLQFEAYAERKAAYSFVMNRLVFISSAEMNYLVELAFPTKIRPRLIADAAADCEDLDSHMLKAIVASDAYRARQRRTLVLGLSDGARTDLFRRVNPMEISHEQVLHAYDVSRLKAETMVKNLRKDLRQIYNREPTDAESKFKYVVLLDDFTASGTTYIREDNRDNEVVWDGKIPRIIRQLESADGLGATIASEGLRMIIIIYVAAQQAMEHINECLPKLPFSKGVIEFQVIHPLSPDTKLSGEGDKAVLDIARKEAYFDAVVDDEHGEVGGSSKRFGYADCRLPVVLHHNTPNNSIFLLWAEDGSKVRGLFPRVSRHRKFE